MLDLLRQMATDKMGNDIKHLKEEFVFLTCGRAEMYAQTVKKQKTSRLDVGSTNQLA